MRSDALEESGQRNTKGFSDASQVANGRVADALLDAPHVSAMHPGFVSQVLLRPALRLPELPDLLAECLRNSVCAFRHMHMLSWLDRERDRLIVVILEVTSTLSTTCILSACTRVVPSL